MMGNGTMRSEWNFDETIRGTVRNVPFQLDLADLETEEWESEEDGKGEWDTTRERHAEPARQSRGKNVSLRERSQLTN